MTEVTKRDIFAMAGLAALGFATTASAEASASTVAPNIQLVVDFYNAQNVPNVDLRHLLRRYLAPECKIHTQGLSNSTSIVVGPDAEAARWEGFLKEYGAKRFGNRIISTWSRGPLVAIEHTNEVVGGPHGNSTLPGLMVSVFLVHDGKIRDWTDYPLS